MTSRAKLLYAGLVFIFIMDMADPTEARHLKVYSPHLEGQGVVELTYYTDYFLDTDRSLSGNLKRDQLIRHSLEIEYAVTDRWMVALYGDFEDPSGGKLQYVQTRIESIYAISEPGERWFDTAFYLEYEVPQRNYKDTDTLEGKLLLQRDIERVSIILNPTLEKPLDENEGLEFGYAIGLYHRTRKNLTPGVEFFGNLGEIGNTKSPKDQDHSVGPVLGISLPHHIKWQIGALFGLTDGSDDITLKSILYYEFE